uniref:MICOS complex subunit MIC13 n=1 Tax=Trichogramma kaykai TaxID=54128 RepID=A0ABD2XBR9_9HYME
MFAVGVDGALGVAIKSSIAGGITYYTVQEGLWSSPEDSAKLYDKLYKNISPIIQKNVPQEVIKEVHELPSLGNMRSCAASYYNKGVLATFQFLADLPTHISNGIERIKQEIEKSTKIAAADEN